MKQLSIGNKLYFGVVSIFLIFAVSFIVFQQNREKQYKVDTLHLRLQDYNDRMNVALELIGDKSEKTLGDYVKGHNERNLRVTLIDKTGHVFYDNMIKDYNRIANHANRTEFIQALKSGEGSSVERHSSTLKRNYFYSATYFPKDGYVIRTALPYDSNLAQSLEADQHYIWFAVVAIILLTVMLYRFTHRLGQNINKLRIFAWRADHNESLDTDDLLEFPNDELGDIAERIIKIYRRLQSTRHEQDRLKRELTQNVAHELKTPVASIQGYLETILNNPDITEETRCQFLERCHAQSERLTSLLRDISTLNKLDDAPQMQNFEQVNIAEIIESIKKETALQLSERKMSFVNNILSDAIVYGNRSLLYSIFRNLTDNAIAYAGERTTITITGSKEPTCWKFTFSDDGIGIGKEHLPRIFERFYRVDKGRSRKMGGTGLGLAIVKNAILLHHGTITAANNPGGGLRFTFTIGMPV
jgi:signal transduction histidine kinase